MGKKFRLLTLVLGVLTGASTFGMIIMNQPFTYVTDSISILAFACLVVTDIKNN